jgi:D-aminopeptidase
VATNAPFGPRSLERLATRCGLGLARCGSTAHHGSGEIFMAFSTTRPNAEFDRDRGLLNECFGAVVEATEEAVLDSLFVADTVVGRDGRTVEGLPVERVLQLVGLPQRGDE